MTAPRLRAVVAVVMGCVLVAGPFGWPDHVHAQEQDLPPLIYVCPMHSDVTSHEDGECPICKMGLEPMRLDSVYTCPIHSIVSEQHAGKCPICGRPLGQVTVSVAWRCVGSGPDLMAPQACADGTASVRVQKSLAHGNHNPQHGGQFFMASDYWHHVEGVYPTPNVFRLYLFDDYTKPLDAAKIAAVKARVVTHVETNPQTFATREVTAVALTPSQDGPYLEAAIETLPFPAEIVVQATFTPDGQEQRFDFTFNEHSVATTAESADGAARLNLEVPDTASEVLSLLVERRDAVQSLVARGGLSEVWVPALQAKELALALEFHAREFPEKRRAEVEAATRAVVLSAFRLDAAGDRGERDEVMKASTALVDAVSAIESLFGAPR
ncbi:MAG: heavy metal-binding domain-containing protein [Acidobacteriota bacterium]